MFEPVEHAVNGLEQVAVFLPPLTDMPASWRADGEVGIWLEVPGSLDKGIGLPPATRDKAVSEGKLLVIEVDAVSREKVRETWVSRTDD